MFLSPQKYFRALEAKPRKRFGQHFLAQPATAERIVQSADLEENDVAVEIGPGLGALTQFILPKASRLHLVEIDRDMAEYLETHMPPTDCNVQIHLQDVMQFDFASLSSSEGKRLVLLGNLPYNISSPLMFHLLESISALKRGVFMVQKEVGERLAAGPGTKDYGVLSVLLGVYARVTPLFDVGPGQFHPPPKVDSSVLRIDFMQESIPDIPCFSFFRRLVNTAFQQRRKTLRNSLKALVGKNGAILETAFSSIGVEPNRRPETLSPNEFLKLGEILERHLST